MFTIKIFKILKMFKYNTKFIRAACWINSKISYKDKNTTLMIFLFCKYCLPLLWCNYWRSLMLWNFASWSRLKLTVQIQLAFYLCDPFSINNRNIAGNSVEKCFVVLNVKLEVKLRFKKVLLTLKPVTLLLSPWTPLPNRLVLLEIFVYPSNKRVLYGPELNL